MNKSAHLRGMGLKKIILKIIFFFGVEKINK